MRYTVVGAAGYIAERHVKAIQASGGEVVAVCDPHSSVGYIDRYFPNCRFYSDYSCCLDEIPVDFVVVCTPNHLHLTHSTQALMHGYNVICEKPLVTSTKDLDLLADCRGDCTLNTILQLRYHPEILALRDSLATRTDSVEIVIDYVAPRGDWYDKSWKGNRSQSGGLLFNIGIHLFDMLCWILGEPHEVSYYPENEKVVKGGFQYDNAKVRWRLSTSGNSKATKTITVNGSSLSFANQFEELHLKSHTEILAGRGFGIEDVRSSTLLIERLHSLYFSEELCRK